VAAPAAPAARSARVGRAARDRVRVYVPRITVGAGRGVPSTAFLLQART
jgi:hypothetical protein